MENVKKKVLLSQFVNLYCLLCICDCSEFCLLLLYLSICCSRLKRVCVLRRIFLKINENQITVDIVQIWICSKQMLFITMLLLLLLFLLICCCIVCYSQKNTSGDCIPKNPTLSPSFYACFVDSFALTSFYLLNAYSVHKCSECFDFIVNILESLRVHSNEQFRRYSTSSSCGKLKCHRKMS